MQKKQKSIDLLPSVRDSKFLVSQVTRLIRNKIQPLSYKHFVLKSGSYSQKFNQSEHKQNIDVSKVHSKKQKRRKGKRNSKQNSIDPKKANSKNRRKAVIQKGCDLDKKDYHELQSKVQQHIILKRMDLMEDEYAYAEQCNKYDKERMCKKLRRSPLSKYLNIFQKSQLPSEKVKRIDEATCEQMIKQIKSAKTIKHIQFMEDNVQGLWNQDKKSQSEKEKQKERNKAKQRVGQLSMGRRQLENKKLKKEIMTEIRKQFQNQGSSKIRISINHKKMIQVV